MPLYYIKGVVDVTVTQFNQDSIELRVEGEGLEEKEREIVESCREFGFQCEILAKTDNEVNLKLSRK